MLRVLIIFSVFFITVNLFLGCEKNNQFSNFSSGASKSKNNDSGDMEFCNYAREEWSKNERNGYLVQKQWQAYRYGFNRLVTYNSQDMGNSLGGLYELEES
jgi:hypothetical protein